MSSTTNIPSAQALNTAVLFLVFNRLDTTKKVFEAIRQAKPPRIYIASDGPRFDKDGEVEKVRNVRDYILQNIDWDCEVKTLFREENLGCKYAVSGAITWFFMHEEQGIILEDDCLPSESFFGYCEELLEKYKTDDTVYLISGDSKGAEHINMKEDYGFCKYPIIWGWASWARVWDNYDPEITDWPKLKKTLPAKISSHKPTAKFWKKVFEKMYNKRIDTWDYQFTYLLLKNQARCIVPKINLISNIGFGADATHTTDVNSDAANRTRHEINIPLTHTPLKNSENKLNDFYDRHEFFSPPFSSKMKNKLTRIRNKLTKKITAQSTSK